MFNMSRFDLARHRRGLTKRDLAHKLEITDRTIANWYSNGSVDDRAVDKIADVLNFPISFFYGDDIEEVKIEAVSFRALSKLSAKKRDIALSQTSLAKLISDWIDSKFELPEVDVPDLHELRYDFSESPTQPTYNYQNANQIDLSISDGSTDEDFCKDSSYPEACAEVVRKAWGLGEKPIPHLIAMLESKGIRVFSLSDDAQEVDACCEWSSNRPFIFLNTAKTSERCRFDAAHELGHLVMHKHGVIESKQMEQEANAFASAFLMPRRSILANPLRNPTLKTITVKKQIWKVSAAALTYRYHKLGLISDWNSISIYKQLAQKGRTFEPDSIPHESSILLSKVFTALHSEGIRLTDISKELHLYSSEISSLTFNVANKFINEAAEKQREKIRILE